MKYKCTDCGQEYDIKPEFCDCGNNVFEEINELEDEIEALFTPETEHTTKVKSIDFTVHSAKTNNFDIPSVLIFIACIILSVLSLIFIGRNTGEINDKIVENQVQTTFENIPSIDKLWKENKKTSPTVAKLPVSEPVAVKVVENKPIETSKKVAHPPKNTAQQPVKTTQNQAQQANAQPQKSSMTEKQKQEIIQKLSTPKSTSQKTEVKKVEPQKNEGQKVVEQPKQEVKQEIQKPDTAQLKKELDNYKITLRNKLAQSINFAAVIGDGKCAVAFKIDQTGNLTNRKFAIQSQNDSLNDVVYAAMMHNPTFKEPPELYKGETLTLTVQMYGGNFEVVLK